MSKATPADGTTIAYDRVGQGPALILVGGAFQYRDFDPRTAEMAKLLSSDYTVVRYDRRGRGESGDTAPYATERGSARIALRSPTTLDSWMSLSPRASATRR